MILYKIIHYYMNFLYDSVIISFFLIQSLIFYVILFPTIHLFLWFFFVSHNLFIFHVIFLHDSFINTSFPASDGQFCFLLQVDVIHIITGKGQVKNHHTCNFL